MEKRAVCTRTKKKVSFSPVCCGSVGRIASSSTTSAIRSSLAAAGATGSLSVITVASPARSIAADIFETVGKS